VSPAAEAPGAATTEPIPGETAPVRRLLPDPGDTTVAAQLHELDLKPLAHGDRPYLVLNFAVTLDGRAPIRSR
jgi:hypothetical protein